tara:strand:- start:74 stop:292 length:219 start_codon:yes stop_codon:yes gene_type:complete
MKKSNKKLDPQEVMKDLDRLMSFADHIDTLDLNKADIDEIGEEASKLEKEIRNKYKGFYNMKDIKNDLDTEE